MKKIAKKKATSKPKLVKSKKPTKADRAITITMVLTMLGLAALLLLSGCAHGGRKKVGGYHKFVQAQPVPTATPTARS